MIPNPRQQNRRWILIIAALFLSTGAMAKTGRLQVDIVDAADKRSISDSSVALVDRQGQPQNGNRDPQGRWIFPSLAPGLYTLNVESPGYQGAREPSVRIVPNKLTPIRITLLELRGEIEEVLVIGDSSTSTRGIGARELGREALRSNAGSGGDAFRALDGLPGLFSSGDFSSFTVRGRGPRDNRILVDGVPFNTVVHFDYEFGAQEEDEEGGGRYSVFAPNLISKARYQPSGWSPAFGGASGALLELDVAKGNRETASATLRIDIAGPELGYDGPSGLWDNTSILFSARRLDFGRFFETVGIDDIGNPRLTDVIFKSSTQINSENTLSFLVIHAPEDFVRDIDNVLASDEDNPGVFEDVLLAQNETENQLATLSWSRLFGESAEWNNRLYARKFERVGTTGEAFPDLAAPDARPEDIPVRETILFSSREENEWGLRSDLSFDNRLGRLSTGLHFSQVDFDFSLALEDDWIRYIYDTDDFRPNPDQRFITLTPDTFNTDFSERENTWVAFLDQQLLFERSELNIGIRSEHNDLRSETLHSPRLRWSYDVSPRLVLSSTLGIYYQSPRTSALASDSQNASLESEENSRVTLGLEFGLSENWALYFDSYYQNLDKLVVEGDRVDLAFSNDGEGFSTGFDVGVSRQFVNGWSANANYSFNHARVSDGPSLPEYDPDFSRPHAINLGLTWEFNDRWKLAGRWKWASGTPRDAFIVYEDVLGPGQPTRFSKEITEQNIDRFDAFNSLNLRVDYRRTFGSTSIIAFIDIINVYGAENPSSSEFNERTGKDVVEDGEVFPLLGFRLEW